MENEVGCIGTDTIHVIFDFSQCSGIGETDDNSHLYLYPNPTKGKFQYEWTGITGEVELRVTDMHGNIVLNKFIQAPGTGEYKGVLNLFGNPNGMYLFRLISEDKVLIRKIMLQ